MRERECGPITRIVAVAMACALCIAGAVTCSATASATIAAPRAVPRLAFPLRLSPQGLGPIRFGMSAAQAETASGLSVGVEESVGDCSFWTLPGLPLPAANLVALDGRFAYVLLFRRNVSTSRGIKVGDGLTRLRHRYRGKLYSGHSAALDAAEMRLFSSTRVGAATYEIEFDIDRGRVGYISAGTRHVIETFGECA